MLTGEPDMIPLRNPFSKTVINDNEPFFNQLELLRVLMLELTSDESDNVFQKEEQMVGIGRTRFKSPP